jgi:hypothetical protein
MITLTIFPFAFKRTYPPSESDNIIHLITLYVITISEGIPFLIQQTSSLSNCNYRNFLKMIALLRVTLPLGTLEKFTGGTPNKKK